jgi:hypothetical protein
VSTSPQLTPRTGDAIGPAPGDPDCDRRQRVWREFPSEPDAATSAVDRETNWPPPLPEMRKPADPFIWFVLTRPRSSASGPFVCQVAVAEGIDPWTTDDEEQGGHHLLERQPLERRPVEKMPLVAVDDPAPGNLLHRGRLGPLLAISHSRCDAKGPPPCG